MGLLSVRSSSRVGRLSGDCGALPRAAPLVFLGVPLGAVLATSCRLWAGLCFPETRVHSQHLQAPRPAHGCFYVRWHRLWIVGTPVPVPAHPLHILTPMADSSLESLPKAMSPLGLVSCGAFKHDSCRFRMSSVIALAPASGSYL